MGITVAIDGPSGAGKSTVAKKVAKEKGYVYVDTGAMYRGLSVFFLDQGVEIKDKEQVKDACDQVELSVSYEEGVQQIYINGENVTPRLREEKVGNVASQISSIPEVREKLLSLQREMAKEQDIVMDGRDIGTCILPDATVKIYLTASVETRAKRRYEELKNQGVPCDYEEIEQDIQKRDDRDISRQIAPLRQAEDAVLIDSSDLTIDQVVDEICSYCP